MYVSTCLTAGCLYVFFARNFLFKFKTKETPYKLQLLCLLISIKSSHFSATPNTSVFKNTFTMIRITYMFEESTIKYITRQRTTARKHTYIRIYIGASVILPPTEEKKENHI